ncbi:phthiocerol/phenolphthiocerol synthesis polyketide synthase type I PpsC [Mycolicibacterium litorale]|uniref:Phthiocerol/phenolphthiocerol synthesis polyketide synthase type I PpsC n=1 Tax=Mycolicibacterium litorale TaxID=758802 RepID=A0A6S6P5Z8_9MYCO|nr:type I polyketide synthase [Mycolicibacterium litorale]BCI53466.1 phthiocerol/phenolphthiocerol synthesis polyketide synthase type I PpsC [Mycolicibacterium litorale]
MSAATPDRRAIITEALRKIDDLTQRLAIAEQGEAEPIAVVGMGCRLPGGVDSPDQYWRLLRDGRSGIVRVPADRWDPDAFFCEDTSVPGTICTVSGGFLTSWQPDEFDAEFFGISPREAAAMDPQQRLLLEVSWEALENAGIPAHTLRGTQTSVFVGMTGYDYMLTLSDKLRADEYDAYVPFGNALNFAAGRLSYFLGVRGPAVVVDTACSSSLVSVHLACQSLRRRESDTALAAGVNLMLKPEANIALSRWGMLAPDGQCKTFDAAADGYVRSEGAGVVVLKRLGDALRDGDRVLALVRGSAVNQDGASSGQTVPNGPAQQALLRQALASSRLTPADIDYIEAHGTGTALGDPIELDALSGVFGDRTDTAPLVLGSVKTNLGHLESGAGIAGFIKTVLSVRNGYIPKHLNFEELTPHAGPGASEFTIASEGMDWPAVNRVRRAGVSSFGVSGTNAHVVIEEAPLPEDVDRPADPVVSTLVVSAKSTQRIASTAAALAEWMTSDAAAGVRLTDVAHTLNHHRARQQRFATVCARNGDAAAAGLRALAAGHTAAGVVPAHEGPCGPGTVFVYSGQGSQWPGMGRQLLTDEPAFAAAVADLEPAFVEQVGFSLREALGDGRAVHGDAVVQPVIMGLQLALTELWRSYGVTPDAVIGHSMGEITAAVVSGALTVAEGLRVIAIRSQLMSRLAGQGAVALLELDPDSTASLIADWPEVSLAVYSSPRQTVIAGPPAQVDALIDKVAAQQRFAKRVNMEVASHNALMEPILPELRRALTDLTPRTPSIRFISTVVDADTTPTLDADYWAANIRRPVRLSQAVRAAAADHTTFVEISAHPMLTHAISETLTEQHHHSIGTLWRDGDDTVTFHTNLNATHTVSAPQTPHPPEPHPVLPHTPWHHTRHWINPTSGPSRDGSHPLLGVGVTDPVTGRRVWENRLNPDMMWLGDHVIDEVCVLPGAAYAEMALAAATEALGTAPDERWTITELSLEQVMPVTDDGVLVATTLTGDASNARIEVRSRSSESSWTTHAVASVRRVDLPVPPALPVAETSSAGPDPEDLYQRLRSAGQQHGPAFQGIVGLSVSESGEARARVRLPSAARRGSGALLLHPVMMDIAVQVLGATTTATDLAGHGDGRSVVLPVAFAGIRPFGDVAEGAFAIGSLRPTEKPDRLAGHVVLTDADGRPLLEIDHIEMMVLRAPGSGDELSDKMFALDWRPTPLDVPVPDAGAAVLLLAEPCDRDETVGAVASTLAAKATAFQWISLTDQEELRSALINSGQSWDHIVLLYPSRDVDDSMPDQQQLDTAQSRTVQAAETVKTISRLGARNSPRLWMITRGAQQLRPDDQVTLAQAGLRGLVRVLTFEHPELNATIVDIEPTGGRSAAALVDELLAGGEHDEVALRDGQRYVRRLVAAPTTVKGQLAPEQRHTVIDIGGPDAFRLQLDQAGRLDGLKVHAAKRVTPQAGQVEIRVTVSALNFSDVLKTMGLYPGLNGQAPVIGGECVGVITEVGDGVDSVQVGQRVIAVAPGTLGSHVTTVEDLVVPVPDELSDNDAATFGVAYLTAWYSLLEVGRLEAGERVLIHSATGGVGLAAVAVAKMVGARVYATAGTEAKRHLLSTLGAEYVGDSRSVDFADEVLEVTDGVGVDVILNSLAGEAITRGVQILAPGGRFVELGKKDVYADASLGLAGLAKSASFSVVDLDLNLRLHPRRHRRMLEDILARAARGDLQPLPVTAFDFDHVIDAFRLMASGGHIGKILVSVPSDGDIRAIAPAPPQPLVTSDGGYIVVGGMGGVGFVAARRLAEQGAGMVVVNGRSGPDADTLAAMAELRARGVRIEVVTGDVAIPGTAERLVSAVQDAGFPLRGVLHSATVLEDQIVLNMSESAVGRVFHPKVAGAWRLHAATAQLDLDWWLVFSSAASLLGSPGQGAYAAANAWLDGLVAYRRSRGLPAVAINWGPWAEVGRGQSFANLGFSMITPEMGMAAMERALAADRATTGVFGLDARQWFQSFPAAAHSSLFSELQDATTVERRGHGRFQAELADMPENERPARVAATIADEICAVLRSTDPIDHSEAMTSLGLDSLMALELRNRLESRLGITLPAALVWAYPTISDLAGALYERMGFEQTPEIPEPESALAEDDLQLLADLVAASEAEVTMEAAES